jgi:hypothetical protein
MYKSLVELGTVFKEENDICIDKKI